MTLELATLIRPRDEAGGSPTDQASINELVVEGSDRKASAAITAETSIVDGVGKRRFAML